MVSRYVIRQMLGSVFVIYLHSTHIFIYKCTFSYPLSKGESNTGVAGNIDKYNCIFKNLIVKWRNKWSLNSGFDNHAFPFGFVQLAQNQANNPYNGVPLLRWQQTYNYGYAPNEKLEVNYTILIHTCIRHLPLYFVILVSKLIT